jgi:membrane protease YdiL (CAAX protease family)
VPCNAVDLSFLVFFGILLLARFLWPSLVFDLLDRAGFFAWYYPGGTPEFKKRQVLWAETLSFPLEFGTVLILAGQFLGARPARLGLRKPQFGRNVLWGLAGAAVLTPVVLGLHMAVVALFTQGLGIAEEKHAFSQLGAEGLTPAEWGLLLFTAIVAAPVLEELLFRGIFQPAAAESRWGGVVGVVLAGAVAATAQYEKIGAAFRQLRDTGWRAATPTVVNALAPLLFVAALLGVVLLVQRRGQNRTIPAVCGTAAFFAMIHVGVWPSPIALFVLALGLGWLKEQTQNLIGPIVLHGLFNGVSCVLVMLGLG